MHSRQQLAQELRSLGLTRGTLVMVHASLRKLGPVQGGAASVIGAIVDAIEAPGTLLMVIGADPAFPFVAEQTPVDTKEMGVLAEVFRRYDGVRVNDHPAARCAARGPLASHLIDDPPLHDYYSAGSPLERFVKSSGRVLRLGADIDTLTLTHLAEYRADLRVKRRARRRYNRADTGELWIESLDDTDGIVHGSDGDYFSQLLVDFVAKGSAAQGRVGSCEAELLDGREFIAFATRWMERSL